jgi:CheY-like chemotaxis protein
MGAAPASARSHRPLDILLVDDDDDIREIATLALQRDGLVTVRSCSDGDSALRELGVSRPDLLLLDVMMPGLDGPATLAAIRRSDPRPPPVIFLTAKTMPSEIERLRQIGGRQVIPKPFDPLHLLEQVLAAWEHGDVG